MRSGEAESFTTAVLVAIYGSFVQTNPTSILSYGPSTRSIE